MAGDWLKVEKDTPEKPEIAGICAALNIPPDVAFSKCFKVWRWADSNTVDGHVKRVTFSFLDSLVGLPGFAQALVDVGWLRARDGALELPNFDRHMGQPAKARALSTSRKRKERDKSCHADVTPKTRPEKRREEKTEEKPPDPPFESKEFAAAWSDWVQHRNEKGIRLTPLAVTKQFNKLARIGEVRAIAAIEHSIANSYQGIYEPTGPKKPDEGRVIPKTTRQERQRMREERSQPIDVVPNLAEAFQALQKGLPAAPHKPAQE